MNLKININIQLDLGKVSLYEVYLYENHFKSLPIFFFFYPLTFVENVSFHLKMHIQCQDLISVL